MTGGGGETPPSSDGEFLLRLLKNPPQYPSQPQQSQLLNHDPAVAEIGPSTPILFHPNLQRNGLPPSWMQHQYHHSPSPSPSPRPLPPSAPHNYFMQNRNTNLGSDPGSTFSYDAVGNDVRNLGHPRANIRATSINQQEQKGFAFGNFRDKQGSMTGFLAEDPSISRQGHMRMEGNRGYNGVEVGFQPNSADFNRDKRPNLVDSRVHVHEGRTYINGSRHWDGKGQKELYSAVDSRVHVQEGKNYSSGDPGWGRKGHKELYSRGTTAMPGINVQQDSEYTSRRGFEQNGERGRTNFGNSRYQSGKSEKEQYMNGSMMDNKLDYRGFSPVSTSSSVSASSALELGRRDTKNRETRGNGTWETTLRRDDVKGDIDLDKLTEQLADVLDLGDEVDEKTEKRRHHKSRDKEYRSDKRGASIMGQRIRNMRRQLPCRVDIERWNIPFLAIYESLIPAEEEKVKQKQLLGLLENVVSKEWPGARLYLYGSCANSFGFSKSDLDVCLTVDDANIQKSAVLLKLADLLQSENLLNVQALTRARVPIVKLMDPKTGISCDICVNNVLAVVNTKLLRDYAEIDVRLRQLAFMVKHWAKSRAVNETYQGTLSSYAYVLMCIHFLQLRRPAILPCLQEMPATYSVAANNVECAFFDRVEKLAGYGSHNGENISQLLWSFFHYWAYCHDYANDVISVRTGCILSKRFKDWTRRIGNDRHLICIEDPFEVSHDLGRVVDKKSIKVLREEFERAADIMQHDPNPCVTLFEPYVPT